MEWIYRLAMQSRRSKNMRRRVEERLPCPIVSVGNLTTGGTGKTPAVQWLTHFLQSQNWKVGIAARGYGGTASDAGGLVSKGGETLMNAAEAGDEAVLHARNLPGAIVAIAKDRHRAVDLCVQCGADIVVLDDGFQFWSLPRSFELVLLDARRPFGNGRMLPFGRLREEPEALQRADAILLTRSDRATAEELAYSLEFVAEFTDAPIIPATHAPRDLRDEKTGEIVPLSFLRGRSVKAFAGLADNTQFYEALRGLGATQIVKLKLEHGDHHSWQRKDFSWFENAPSINQHQKEIFQSIPVITTEKDAVKLDATWFREPLYSLRIAMQIEREAVLKGLLFAKLEKEQR